MLLTLILDSGLIDLKIVFKFKGSIFNQKENIVLEVPGKTSVRKALEIMTRQKPHLKNLIFEGKKIRNDILLMVDRLDILSMNLLDMPLKKGQEVVVLPLAHGG
jgi:molybdopterin converting factor small subunit